VESAARGTGPENIHAVEGFDGAASATGGSGAFRVYGN